MMLAFSIFILVISLLAWLGQVLSFASPGLAVKLGLIESDADVDPVFYADVRAECLWDSLTLWTLPLSAVFFILHISSWPMFGLIGGSMYIYFSGRGVLQRLTMQKRGIRVGREDTVRTACIFLAIWGMSGLAMVILSVYAISNGEIKCQ